MAIRTSISVTWLKRWKKNSKTKKPTPRLLPTEIWLRIISYLPPPEAWVKPRLYRLNSIFLDHYIRKTYQDIVLFNPVPYLEGFSNTQFQDEHLTRRNLSVLRDPRRSEVVKALKIRFKMRCFDYRREAAEPENLEMALRSDLELLKEGQHTPPLPSLGDSPHIHLPRLNKLTLDLSKALGLRVDPSKLFDKTFREHIYPFLVAHASLITAFSFSTPQDDPHIGDACFLGLPAFPSLETLSVHIYLDQSSTWDGASRFLQQYSTKLKKLKIILSQRHILERRSRDSIISPPSLYDWTKQQFWSIPMPALTEFQLFTNITPGEGGPTLDFQPPRSSPLLERLVLSKPMPMPGDLEKLIGHLSSSDSAHELKELFMPRAELNLLGLRGLAQGFPQLRRLSVHSIDLGINLDGADASVLGETTARAARNFSDWALDQLDFRYFPSSNSDSVKYRRAIAATLPNVRFLQGSDRVLWVEGWVGGRQEV